MPPMKTLTLNVPEVALQHFINAVCKPGEFNPAPETLPPDADGQAIARLINYMADVSGANAVAAAAEHARKQTSLAVEAQRVALSALVSGEIS